MYHTLRFAAVAAAIVVLGYTAMVGGVIGGLIGLQTPDVTGSLAPDLNGGMRGVYAGLIASTAIGLPLAISAALAILRWSRFGHASPRAK